MEERRKYVRLGTSVEVEHEVLKEEGTETSMSRNIGMGGIRLIVFERLQSETKLNLVIKLPDGSPPIETVGKVVWQEPFSISTEGDKEHYDTGIEFLGIADADKVRIEKFVFRYLKE